MTTILSSTEIGGYEYEGNRHCVDCVRTIVKRALMELGVTDIDRDTSATEVLIDLLAMIIDVDRAYADSDEIPVPFTMTQAYADSDRARLFGESDTCECGNDFTGEF